MTKRTSTKPKLKLGDLSQREYEILRSGIKAGVRMTLVAINEFRTGEISHSLEDGAMQEILDNGMPRA